MMMGLFDDDDFELDELLDSIRKYPPYATELKEGYVQELFNRCLATAGTGEVVASTLFPSAMGWDGSEKLIHFDRDQLIQNKKGIEYLLGQLEEAHKEKRPNSLTIDDYNTLYTGKHWTSNKATLLKLLYMGAAAEIRVISPFWGPHIEELLGRKANYDPYTSIMVPVVKPTLSPKDAGFAAWWEAHKADWEV